jgi:hypothetical protein
MSDTTYYMGAHKLLGIPSALLLINTQLQLGVALLPAILTVSTVSSQLNNLPELTSSSNPSL